MLLPRLVSGRNFRIAYALGDTRKEFNHEDVRDHAPQRLGIQRRTRKRRAALSTQVAEEDMPDQVKWIRSYVLDEEDGTLGTVCIYQAEDDDVILEHAQRAELPADEVIPVVNTIIVRDDP